MSKNFYKILCLVGGVLLCNPNLMVKPTLAENPSLNDGILCVAQGKTSQGNKIYIYSSVIDDDSIKKKQPVSITMNEPVTTIDETDMVVVNSDDNTVTIIDSVTGSAPEMQPVGTASVTYQGNNTFSGKSEAGNPVTMTLSNNYKALTIQHDNDTFKGSCH